MLQIQRIGQDEFTLNASHEEWASIRTILEHAIEVHGDTELETILQLSKATKSMPSHTKTRFPLH